MSNKAIVLDANILIRAVLGKRVRELILPIALELYAGMQPQAFQRIAVRDADDWPVLACAMTLGCPVWTEDADFFGTGVPTWTTDRIALYFAL